MCVLFECLYRVMQWGIYFATVAGGTYLLFFNFQLQGDLYMCSQKQMGPTYNLLSSSKGLAVYLIPPSGVASVIILIFLLLLCFICVSMPTVIRPSLIGKWTWDFDACNSRRSHAHSPCSCQPLHLKTTVQMQTTHCTSGHSVYTYRAQVHPTTLLYSVLHGKKWIKFIIFWLDKMLT